MKNFTRSLIAASLVLTVSMNAYSQDVFKAANVGIGTTTPQQKLDVAGSIKFSGALMPGGVSGSAGNILLSQGTATPIWLANGTSGTILIANSAGIPTWSSANGVFTTSNIVNGGVSSPVVVTNGIGQVVGSGNVTLDVQGTLNGILYGQGTGSSAIFTSAGTLGQVLEANSAGVPTWTTPSLTAGWALIGNSIAATNFLGTTDAEPLVFEVNSVNAGRIDLTYPGSNNNTYLGSGAGNGDGGILQVGIGISALGGQVGTSSGGNSVMGAFAYPTATSGDWNVAVGAFSQYNASFVNANQGYNTGIGAYTLYSDNTGANSAVVGSFETAIGYQSMYGSGTPTTYGNYNTALGTYSLYNISSGGANTALGSNALIATTAGRNVGVGDSSLYSNTTGEYNTGLGYQSNVGIGNLTNATAIGYQAVAPASNTITLGNSAVTSLYLPGYTSVGSLFYTAANTGQVAALAPGASGTILQSNGTSSVPSWISVAGINAVTGTPPIYITNPSSPTTPNIGIQGLPNNSDQWGVLYSLGSGTSALFTPTPTAAGLTLQSNGTGAPTWTTPSASANAWNLTGNANATASSFLGTTDAEPLVFEVDGKQAGRIDLSYASYSIGNTALGYGAGNSDGGILQVAIGMEALGSTATGVGGGANVAVGAYAYPSSPEGDWAVAIGAYSQYSASFNNYNAGYNVSVGAYSMYSNSTGSNSNVVGSYNTAIGYQSMYGNPSSPSVYGNYNVAVGTYSLYGITTGWSNTALGTNALLATTASKNVGVGDSSLYSNTTGEYNTGLGYQSNVSAGNLTNATAIGYQAVAGESNSLILGNGAAFVGINTSTPAQLLEIGGTANTIRVDALKGGGTYNSGAITNAGNIVYTNNTTGDLYSLPNPGTINGQVLSLTTAGVPTWNTISSSAFTTYNITGNTGTSVVVGGGNLNSVVGSSNVTLDVQGTAGGIFYGQGLGTPATFSSAGTTGQVLTSGGTGVPTWTTPSLTASWALNGNSVTTSNFLGTTDAEPIRFEVNGVNAGSLDPFATFANVYLGGASTSPALGGAGNDDQGGYNVGIGLSALASGTVNTYNGNNVAVGAYSLAAMTGGSQNVAIGYSSQRYFNPGATSTNGGNIAVGGSSLYSNTTGIYNTALGYQSMYGSGSPSAYGSYNTALGYNSLFNPGTGSSNTALGSWSLYSSSGGRNTAVGDSSLYSNTTGEYNTALGYQANVGAGNLTNATAIGYQASAPASNSIALGNSAATALYLPGYTSVGSILYTAASSGQIASLIPGAAGTILASNGTSSVPTWVSVSGVNSVSGTAPIYVNTNTPYSSSAPNVYIQGLPNNSDAGGVLYSLGSGTSALFTPTPTTSGLLLTSNGTSAPTWASPASSSNSWSLSGNSIAATSFLGTTDNEALVFEVNGAQAGRIDPYFAAGNNNTYLGSWGVLGSTTYGSAGNGDEGGSNVGLGISALGSAGSSSINASNVAVGAFALATTTGGAQNVAIGAYSQLHGAFTSTSQGYNNAIGAYTMYSNTTGSYNTAVGQQSMYGSGSPSVYGAYNTAVGYYSLYSIGSGGANTALGSNSLIATTAGKNVGVGDSALWSNTTGEYNIGLGYQSNVGAGNLSNATAIGYQATAPVSNSITLGNTAATSLYLPGYTSAGALLYTSASSGLIAGLVPGASGTVLVSGGTASAPTWVGVGGINSVTGTPPIYVNSSSPSSPNVYIQGLPNNSDAGGILYSLGSGTSALFTPTPTAANLVLTSAGSGGAPTWQSTAASSSAWNLVGNTGTTPGTDFVGTTNAEGLMFKVDGIPSGMIDYNTNANVYFGYGTGNAASGDYGTNDVGIGTEALANVPSGAALEDVVAVGAYAMYDATSDGSTAAAAIGSYSQFYNTGAENVSVGAYSLYSNTAGADETALGYQAMNGSVNDATMGNSNTAIGYEALYKITTGGANTAVGSNALYGSTGGKNTAVGDSALASNTNGEYNTGLGYQALANTSGSNGNTTGSYNTALGYYANVASGALSNATAIGAYAYVAQSNSMVLGAVNGTNGYTGTSTEVGIGTSTPHQALEIAPTSATIRVDGMANGDTYNTQITASPGNIVYTNNTTGDLYSLPNGANGTVLTLNANSVPSWASPNAALTTYSITGNTGTSVVIAGGNLNSVVGSGNVTLDVQGTQGGVFYGNGAGTAASFNTAGSAGQVLLSGGVGAPTWGSANASLTTNSIVNGGGSSSVVVGNGANQVVGATNVSVDVQGTLNGILYGQGSGNSAIFSSAGASGQVLAANSSGVPTWTTLTAPNAWYITGNTISAAYGTNYIGTTGAGSPLEFETDSYYAGLIDANASNIYFGKGTGGDSTVFNNVANQNVAIGWEAFASLPSTTNVGEVTAIGAEALHNDQAGFNTAVGAYSLHNNTLGTPNDAFGYGAGLNITIGTNNVLLGFESSYNQTTGSYNVSVGDSSLYGGGEAGGTPATYVANYNTAVGVSALSGIGTGVANGIGGSNNTAVGYESLIHTTTGTGNVAAGYQAGYINTTGSENTLLGYQASVSANNLTNAMAVGYQAIAPVSNSITLGNSSVTSLYLPGYSAVGAILYTSANSGLVAALIPGASGTVLTSNGTSSAPSWVSVAGVNNVTGTPPIYSTGGTSPNVYIQGLPNNSDMGGVLYSLGSGTSALFTPTGVSGDVLQSNGTAAPTWVSPSSSGAWALTGNSIVSGNILGTLDDVSLRFEVDGKNAGSIDPLNSGYSNANVYLGSFGIIGSTTYGGAGNTDAGNANVGVGLSALGSAGGPNTTNTNGGNVAVGAFALASAIYGQNNVAIGSYSQAQAAWATELGFNVAVGSYSLYSNSTGQYNTSLGYQSMYGSGSATSVGYYNTAEGYNALFKAGAGEASNTAIGSYALYNTAASRNTAVGDSALYTNTTGINNTALGYQANVSVNNLTNATVIGYQATATASNSVTLGNSSASLYLPGYTVVGSLFYTSPAGGGLVAGLAPGASGDILESTGTASAPSWAPAAGIDNVIGVQPIYSTGGSTPSISIQGEPSGLDAGGVLYSAGAGTSALFTPTGTVGYFLESNGTAAPSWVSASGSSGWGLNGNSGTTYTSNWVGTNDDNGLQFEVNGSEAGMIEYNDDSQNGGFGNTGLGYQVLANDYNYNVNNYRGGGPNTAMGYQALTSDQGGYDLVAMGYEALENNYYATDNTALGFQALNNNDADQSGSAYANTAVGSMSMQNNQDGNSNVAEGYQSLYSNFYASDNVGIGASSLYNNDNDQSGQANYNTAVGVNSLINDIDGSSNTAIGYNATVGVESSVGILTNATAIGANATVNTSNTVQLGYQCSVQFDEALMPAGNPGTAGQYLVSSGPGAAPTWAGSGGGGQAWNLTGNTGTSASNFIGTLDDAALAFEVNGKNAGSIDPLNNDYAAGNVYLGSYGTLGSTTFGGAGNSDAGNANVGIGLSALGSAGGPQFVGSNTGGNTNGYNGANTAVGAFSLASDVLGQDEVAIGAFSQFLGNFGSVNNGFNTSLGSYSLYSNTTGQYNTSVGYYSMFGSGSGTAVGSYNTAEGYNSLYKAGAGEASNTAIGSYALYNTAASKNTAVGDSALYSNTSGTNNTALGYGANVSSGTLTNATAIGAYAYAANSNTLILGQISGVGQGTANTNVGIGTNAPATDAALAIKTNHLETQVGTSNTTITAGNIGATPSVAISGTDVAGNILYTPGALGPWSAGTQVTVNFANAYSYAPVVIITPANSATAQIMSTYLPYVTVTTSGFTITSVTAVANNNQLSFNYFVIETQ